MEEGPSDAVAADSASPSSPADVASAETSLSGVDPVIPLEDESTVTAKLTNEEKVEQTSESSVSDSPTSSEAYPEPVTVPEDVTDEVSLPAASDEVSPDEDSSPSPLESEDKTETPPMPSEEPKLSAEDHAEALSAAAPLESELVPSEPEPSSPSESVPADSSSMGDVPDVLESTEESPLPSSEATDTSSPEEQPSLSTNEVPNELSSPETPEVADDAFPPPEMKQDSPPSVAQEEQQEDPSPVSLPEEIAPASSTPADVAVASSEGEKAEEEVDSHAHASAPAEAQSSVSDAAAPANASVPPTNEDGQQDKQEGCAQQ